MIVCSVNMGVFTKSQVEDIKNIVKGSFSKIFSSEVIMKPVIDSLSSVFSARFDQLCGEYEEKILKLQEENKVLQTNLDRLEQYSRRCNIRMFGVEDSVRDNDLESKVIEIFQNKMNITITADQIDRCHRVGPNTSKSRPVIVKFTNYKSKATVYNNKKQLKGSKIVIAEDLTSVRYQLLRGAKEKFGARDVWTADGVVFCRRNGIKCRLISELDLSE